MFYVQGAASGPGVRLPRGPALRLQRLEILREQALRKAVHRRRGLAVFTRLCWPKLFEGRQLLWNFHHDWVCDEFEAISRGENQSAVICQPPRSLKTLLSAVFLPAWHLLQNPHHSFLNATINDQKAEESSRLCRDLILTPLYEELRDIAVRHHGWPAWKLTKMETLVWGTSAGGGYHGLGVKSRVIGSGGDFHLYDDLLDPNELANATPERALELCLSAQRFVWEYMTTRFNDSNAKRRLMIAHRVHEADPPGRALREGWRAVVLPLHADPDRPDHYALDTRPRGALLHPARLSEEEARKDMEAVGPQAPALYEQDPTPAKGGLLDADWLTQHYDDDPMVMAASCEEIVISSDAAKKPTGAADFHGLNVWGRGVIRKHLLDRQTERLDYPSYERAMDTLIVKWAPVLPGRVVALIEDTANGTTYLQSRSKAWFQMEEVEPGRWEPVLRDDRGERARPHLLVRDAPQIPLIPFHPSRDTPGDDKSKPARFLYFVRSAQGREVWTPNPVRFPWVRVWMAAMVGFPKTAHDDDADATSQCFVRWALGGGGMDAFLQFMGG